MFRLACKRCGKKNIINNGKQKLIQKYKCEDCKYNFIRDDGRITHERQKKRFAITFLHDEDHKMTIEEIAEVFKVKIKTVSQ